MSEFLSQARAQCWSLYRRYYGNDNYLHYRDRYQRTVLTYLKPESYVLDAGCGSNMVFTQQVARKARFVVGTDMAALSGADASGSFALRSDLNALPFKDETFDIVVSMSVFEHLRTPDRVFAEIARTLKPRGIVIVLTPNKHDYVSFIARLTPTRFHRWILNSIQQRNECDTFPTFFRANTKHDLLASLRRGHLTPLEISFHNQYPAYLMFSPLLFRLGALYERLTSRYETFAGLRSWILLIAQK